MEMSSLSVEQSIVLETDTTNGFPLYSPVVEDHERKVDEQTPKLHTKKNLIKRYEFMLFYAVVGALVL